MPVILCWRLLQEMKSANGAGDPEQQEIARE